MSEFALSCANPSKNSTEGWPPTRFIEAKTPQELLLLVLRELRLELLRLGVQLGGLVGLLDGGRLCLIHSSDAVCWAIVTSF